VGRRVVVTGMGVCAPLRFEEIVEGGCGLVPPREWSVPELTLRVGHVPGDVPAAVKALPGSWKPERLDPFSHFALLAAHEARADSGLDDSELEWAAVVVASAMGGERTHYVASAQLAEHRLAENGRRLRLSPFTAPKLMPNAASANVALLLGSHGPNVSPAAACASGAYAIAQAVDLIRFGRAEVAVTGAAEAPCEEISARGFLAGDALSPTGRSLPFHKERDGFVLAEGSAILILEERERALRRGARVYAEIAGVGLTCDAHHVVAPHPEGRFAVEAMTAALREAELSPDQVGYVNAHATGTPVGDVVECRAVRALFRERLPLVSSTKGATGHLLGAAGALEAVYTIAALHTGRIPPTLHLDDAATDPECAAGGLDFVPDAGRELRLRAALSNSFAFGGHNASLLFTRP
jgi:3-oxoacyl-[acyl-carrier-protein] synthase II